MTKPNPKQDRRVLRTCRTLRDALVQLILQRGWDEITVQDICERADVGRSTFYTHFADKEELLLSGFDDLRRALREQGRASGVPLGFARAMIEHASENQRLFRALVGKRSGHAVEKRFRELVVDLVTEDLESLAPGSPRARGPASYVAGGFMQLLAWWLDTRTTLTPPELDRLFRELSTPLLETLRRH